MSQLKPRDCQEERAELMSTIRVPLRQEKPLRCYPLASVDNNLEASDDYFLLQRRSAF